MKNTEELQNQIEAKTRRAAELRAQHSEVEKQLAAARGDLGRAIADGKSQSAQAENRARMREYSEALEGLTSGLTIIEKDAAELQAALKPAQLEETEAENIDATTAYWHALKVADETFSEFWAKFMVNEGAALFESMESANSAQRAFESAGGARRYVPITEKGGDHVRIRQVIESVNVALDFRNIRPESLGTRREEAQQPDWYTAMERKAA